jgi:hypothetical protein
MAFGEESEPVVFKNTTCLRESPRAMLVRIDGKERWVPKSVVHDDSEVFDAKENATGKLVLVGWWARENDLA